MRELLHIKFGNDKFWENSYQMQIVNFLFLLCIDGLRTLQSSSPCIPEHEK